MTRRQELKWPRGSSPRAWPKIPPLVPAKPNSLQEGPVPAGVTPSPYIGDRATPRAWGLKRPEHPSWGPLTATPCFCLPLRSETSSFDSCPGWPALEGGHYTPGTWSGPGPTGGHTSSPTWVSNGDRAPAISRARGKWIPSPPVRSSHLDKIYHQNTWPARPALGLWCWHRTAGRSPRSPTTSTPPCSPFLAYSDGQAI